MNGAESNLQKGKAVTVMQLAMSLGTSMIGVGLLAFPRIVVNLVGTGAPLATLAAVTLTLGISLLIAYMGGQYPDQTMFEYADSLIWRWLATIIHVLTGLYFLVLAGLAAREFGEVVVTSVLQRTPVEVTVMTMLVLASIAARNSVFTVVRILAFYMLLVYFLALIIVLLTLTSASSVNMLPVIAHGTTAFSMVQAILTIAALFQNSVTPALIIPYMTKPKQAWKGVFFGVSASGALYLVLILANMGVFGVEEIKHLLWPTLDLAKTATLPGLFIERIDPFFIAIWVTAVFTGILSSYYLAIRSFSDVLQLNDHRVLSTAAFPIIFTLALIPRSVANLYAIVEVVGQSGLSLTMGYPLLLLAAHAFKRRRQKGQARGGQKQPQGGVGTA